MRWDAPRATGHASQGVVEQHAGTGVEAFPHAVRERVDEGHRLDQVRRELFDQQAALGQRLSDQAKIEHLEVAQAAMNQLARTTRGAGGEVARLDEADRQAACGCVERSASTDDATADDEDVELGACHGVEGRLA